MKSPSLCIRNIGTLLTLVPSTTGGPLGKIRSAALVIRHGKIAWWGSDKKIPRSLSAVKTVDAQGRLVTPGLVECHTHSIFSGSREDEFFAWLQGTDYETIAKKGGGIQSTVNATREAGSRLLDTLLRARLDRFLSFGVTTVEVKSGYGLNFDEEIRHLKILRSVKHPVQTLATFLGAHVIPREYRRRRSAYVNLVAQRMIPEVSAAGLARICDVFCDRGAFTTAEAAKILLSARRHGMDLKLHADQLSDTGAAKLAVQFGALSADHLDHVRPSNVKVLARSKTVAVLVPGSVMFMGKSKFPPARKLLDEGARVALSTDCNPGTNMTENLPLAMTLGATALKMTAEEVWQGVTLNAARALGLKDRGSLHMGSRGDVVLWDAHRPEEIPYHYGISLAHAVFIGGRRVLG